MARRRGFFAELQHQAAVAERDRQRAQAAAMRDAQRRQKAAEQARAAAERAGLAANRADARARADAEREAKRLHLAAQEAQVESLNSRLRSQLDDIDSVLSWTLSFDDHVDLAGLRQVPKHPPFTSLHQDPLPPPSPITAPVEPTFTEPAAPTGLGAMFSKKKHAAAVEEARVAFAQQQAAWEAEAAAVPVRQLEQMNKYQAAEAARLTRLHADRDTYDKACRQRQEEADAKNAQLDDLTARLQAGEKDAVEDYLSIVFGNSVYPDPIAVDIEHSYQPVDKELQIELRLPSTTAVVRDHWFSRRR